MAESACTFEIIQISCISTRPTAQYPGGQEYGRVSSLFLLSIPVYYNGKLSRI